MGCFRAKNDPPPLGASFCEVGEIFPPKNPLWMATREPIFGHFWPFLGLLAIFGGILDPPPRDPLFWGGTPRKPDFWDFSDFSDFGVFGHMVILGYIL